MNCETYEDLVTAHVDNALSPLETAAVETPLRTCVYCQRLFAEESSFHVAFAARRLIGPIPRDVEQRLHNALRAGTGEKTSLWERIRTWVDLTPTFSRVAFTLATVGIFKVLVLPQFLRPTASPPD